MFSLCFLSDFNGLTRQPPEPPYEKKKLRNYKIIIDPCLHRDQPQKVYRFDGHLPGVIIVFNPFFQPSVLRIELFFSTEIWMLWNDV